MITTMWPLQKIHLKILHNKEGNTYTHEAMKKYKLYYCNTLYEN